MSSHPPADRPSVLFVCVHNAGRSQMAAGYLRQLAGEAIEVRSAGSAPGDQVNPAAVAAMAEEGIDIAAATPTLLTTESVQVSDVVITMGCGDADLPGQALRGLAARRSCGTGTRGGPTDSRRDPAQGRGPDRFPDLIG